MIAKDFINGFLAVFRGMSIVFRSKKLMFIAAAPILISVILFFTFIGFATPHFFDIQNYLRDSSLHLVGTWAPQLLIQIFSTLAAIFIFVALFFASVYILFLLTKILASPFYAVLSSEVLKGRGFTKASGLGFWRWMFLSFRTTAVSLLEVVLFGFIGVLLFVFSFIPVLNVLAGFGFFLIMAYDSTDYALDVLNLGLNERVRYFFSHFAQFCGFALAMSLVMLIPGLNLVLLAVSVAGGADLVSLNLKRQGR